MRTLAILLAGLAVAALVYLATSGHVVFIPILLIPPLGLFTWGRR